MNDQPIALALSGGGVRAMVFHLGVLRFLAENNLLENVSHISTVSGGSLVLGLLLKNNGMEWPTSSQYLEYCLPNLQKNMCSKSLMGGMIRQLKHPANWRFLLSRANLLAGVLREEWNIKECLSELPLKPEWSINGTTAETGKRFRFKKENFGDYVLGYAPSQKFPLANALAVSAAFPGGIGPLLIEADLYEWTKREWAKPIQDSNRIKLEYPQIHLYDGGVYDNLGLEPFFDSGTGKPKDSVQDATIIVSDAGAPLASGFSLSKVNPWRMKRVLDIISDQSRALRVRSFMDYLKKDQSKGFYIHLKDSVSDPLSCHYVNFSCNFPTTLKKPTEEDFIMLLDHGYKAFQRKKSLIDLVKVI